MATLKTVQLQKVRLAGSGCTSSATSIIIQSLKYLDGTDVAITEFGDYGFATLEPGTAKEESIKFTGITQNDDETATLTGVTRGLSFKYPFAETAGNKQSHAGGTILVLSNTSAFYDQIKDYIDGIAVAGAPDADETTKGITKLSVAPASATEPIAVGDNDPRVPTADENNAMAGGGSLGTPSSSNKYQTETGVTAALASLLPPGVTSPYAGRTAPAGWLMCDGSAVSRTTYASLFAVIVPSQTYAASSASPTVITAEAHGLVAGDRVHFTTATGGHGITAGTTYFVSATSLGADSFKISLVPGGTLINTTGTESGTLYKSAWGAGDGSTTFNLPDLRSSFPVGKSASAPTIAITFDDGLVSTGDDTITVPDDFFPHQGQAVALTNSGGALPTGLSATTYYVIRASTTTIKLATSQANANAGTAVNITEASGGGIHTLTYTLSTHTVLGKKGGEEKHGLADGEMASHNHSIQKNDGAGVGSVMASTTGGSDSATVSTVGSDTQHNNMPPFVTINYIIKT